MRDYKDTSLLVLVTPRQRVTFHSLISATDLTYPDALSHLWSLRPSVLRPALFLARTRSPTKACASPASSPPSSLSTSASNPRHTNLARCSASLSPAVVNSLYSWCRLTPVKMLERPDFLLRRLECFHGVGGSSSSEVLDAGASAMSGSSREISKTDRNVRYVESLEDKKREELAQPKENHKPADTFP